MFVSQHKDVFANQENRQNILGGEGIDLWLQVLQIATSQIVKEDFLVLSFSQGSPFQTLAAQGFTTICINLQMCRSSGFEVAKFAFLLEPFVNVSKLFQ